MIGTTVGKKYQIIEKLREQRFYDVYAARIVNTETRSIIKVLRPEYVTPGRTIDKLKPNLAVIASLRHTGIAHLRDFDEDGMLFLAEEYYEGTLLRDILAAGSSLNSLQTLELGIRIVEALAHAHAKGIAHGLLSPESVVVLNDLNVKVADFYTLDHITAGMNITGKGEGGRDSRYCAPEVISGMAASPQSDVYSAGVLIYQLITGKLPFTSQQAIEIAFDRDFYAPTPPQEINPRVPALLNSVVLKALKPKPAARYESAAEFLSELLLCRTSMMRAMGTDRFSAPPGTDAPISPTAADARADYAPAFRHEASMETPKPSIKTAPVIEEADVEDKKFKKRLYIAIGSGVAFFILVLIVGAVMFKTWFGQPGGKDIQVPNVMQKTLTEARSILGLAKLENTVIEEFNDEIPEGMVFRQEPLAGTPIKEGRTVTLYVSKGGEEKSVPDLIGMKEREAERRIEQLGFKVGDKEYEFDEDTPKGHVIDQRPNPGSKKGIGSFIKLIISKGTEPNMVSMPDLTGLDINEARDLLARNEIPLGGITSVPTIASSPDAVVDQSVLPGTSVNTKTMKPVDISIAEQPDEFSTGDNGVDSGGVKTKTINMTVAGEGDSEVVVIVTDANSRKEVYRRTHKKGDRVGIPVNGAGKIYVKIYINGELEKELDF